MVKVEDAIRAANKSLKKRPMSDQIAWCIDYFQKSIFSIKRMMHRPGTRKSIVHIHKELGDAQAWVEEIMKKLGLPVVEGKDKEGGGRHSNKVKAEVKKLTEQNERLQSQVNELMEINKKREGEILELKSKKRGQ